jgi:acyl-CoA synthetase (AMP-forming)/AMP-acid ligase II
VTASTSRPFDPNVLNWLRDPVIDQGLSFLESGDDWSFHDYRSLAAIAQGAARALEERGIGEGDRVALVLDTGPDFIATFFGALLRSALPAAVTPPGALPGEQYEAHLTAALRAIDANVVVTDQRLHPSVAPASAGVGVPHTAIITPPFDAAAGSIDTSRRHGPAYIQFTSGSTGRPRPRVVSWEGLEANLNAIGGWLELDRDRDAGASWLPLHHDMGLCFLLTPMCGSGSVRLMRPDQFVRSPLRWLRCFAEGATITAAPLFGYRYVVRRVKPSMLQGLDLSGFRAAIVGGERVDPSVISDFLRLLAPAGVRPDVVLPAYGMAEATFIVSGKALRTPARAVRLASDGHAQGDAAAVIDETLLDGSPVDGEGWVVGCGQPMSGVRVSIVDEAGYELPEGRVGEIRVEGGSLTKPYVGGEQAEPDGGSLLTGDAGFVLAGQVYVLGRMGDSVKVHGRAVFAEDIEARVVAALGVQPHRCAVIAGNHRDVATAVLLLEAPGEQDIETARGALDGIVGEDVTIRVLAVDRGAILRTSSGKPRRRVLWDLFAAGAIS